MEKILVTNQKRTVCIEVNKINVLRIRKYGFKKGLSMKDAMADLVKNIKSSLERNKKGLCWNPMENYLKNKSNIKSK